MAVEDFIQFSDVKQTVEKEIKPKPSVAELTTIESPGKPSPANMLENSNEKKIFRKRRIKKTETAEASFIKSPTRDAILIITEKPQAAQKIARALGKPREYKEEGVSYYEIEKGGEKIIVSSAVGHLFNLTYAQGQKGWPIYDLLWEPSFNRKKSSFTKRYFNLLKKLSRRAKEYIIATDYDVEGEVIGWNVLRFICGQANGKRMKFSTLTDSEINKSFEKTLPELNWGNAYAGEARHFIDWLYGINLSRALMSALKRTGSFKILSIGRVQGPALKLIVDKENDILNFKSRPFWQIFAHAGGVVFQHIKDIFDEQELSKFKDIKEGNVETKKSKENVPPFPPFDLTTLQKEAYRLYKINPSETLQIAQKLYLGGLISYPRTSSQKIPNEIEPHKILKALVKNFPEAKSAKRTKPVEGGKTDPAHPSIYPTGDFQQISEKEEKLYNIIVKRFIACFSDDAKIATKKLTLTVLSKSEDIIFTASGLEVLERGWASFYPYEFEEFSIPDLSGKIIIDKIDIQQKETQPPHRYTPTSLVSLLEKKNLGTKSTRSMIVETLFERGYLDGKSIRATPLGMRLIHALDKYSPIIIDENLTRLLEEEMEKIQESTSDFEKKEKEIIEKAKRVISDISKEFKVNEINIGMELMKAIDEIRQINYQSNILMGCPSCKIGELRILYSKKTKRYFVACSKYPDCTQTYSLPPNALIKKAETQCPADLFPKLLAIRKGKRPWEFCFNPDCTIEKEKREKREKDFGRNYIEK